MQTTKRIEWAAIGLFAITACAPTAPTSVDTAAGEAAIRSADQAHVDAFNAGDVDTIVAGYAEDAVVMPSDAPAVSGREAIRKMFAESIAGAKAAGLTESLGEYTSVVSGNVGWSAGTSKETNAKGATVWAGKFLATWRRTDGKWLAVRDTWNSDGPAVPAVPATSNK
jgi:ketosteroid isomerase-like protein